MSTAPPDDIPTSQRVVLYNLLSDISPDSHNQTTTNPHNQTTKQRHGLQNPSNEDKLFDLIRELYNLLSGISPSSKHPQIQTTKHPQIHTTKQQNQEIARESVQMGNIIQLFTTVEK